MIPLLLCAAMSLANAPDTISDRLNAQLTPFLAARAASGEFSGVVLVARNGVPIYSAAYGMADRARHVPVTINTPFNLGSMNKMWTAAAIAQLVQQKRVDLDGVVGRYLPDYPNADVRDHVTVRELLSHTSGLGDYFQNGYLKNHTFINSMKDYLPFFAADPLQFKPGSRMGYSNAGFAVLGMIIERVSGKSYYDYMATNIFARAGMKNASFRDIRSHPNDIAIGYMKADDGTIAPNWDDIEQHSGPAGGAFASAPDIVAFSRAWFGGKLADKSLVDTFTRGEVNMGAMRYGFGFGVGSMNGVRFVGHNGGAPGVNTDFVSLPDQGIDIVVLTNIDDPAAGVVRDRALRLIVGLQPVAVPPQAQAPRGPVMGPPPELAATDARIAPAREFVTLLLSGDRAKVDAFLRSHAAAADNAGSLKADVDAIMSAQSKPFEFRAIREGMQPGQVIVEAVVDGEFAGFAIGIGNAPPFPITSIKRLMLR